MAKRIALVTGGTGGIGTAICRRLSEDGFNVVAGYYGGGKHELAQAWQDEQKAAGYDIQIAFGNVRETNSCEECVQDIEKKVGPIDTLVNNAGVTKDSMFKKMTWEQWKGVISANLDSVFNMTRVVINGMISRGFGRIVCISSVNAQRGQMGQTNYAAAKSGMHGFTKALALEVARKNITVNTISPGYIETSMVMAVAEKIRNKIIEDIPVGRLGTPKEVARVVSFLVEEDAGYITGANIAVNGGLHMF